MSNGNAIASLICGIIGLLLFPFSIPAVILGILGLKDYNKDPSIGGKGMAIAGIVLGALVILGLLLLLLIFIGTMAYFGTMNPDSMLPEKCSFPIQLSCNDFSVTSNRVIVTITNGAGRDMIINKATVTSSAIKGEKCEKDYSTSPIELKNGARETIQVEKCLAQNTGQSKNRYDVILDYNWADNSVKHQITGEISAKVEG